MIERLPPVGWADVATKHDIAAVQADLVSLEQRFDDELARRSAELEAHVTRTLMTSTLVGIGVQTAVVGLVVGLT